MNGNLDDEKFLVFFSLVLFSNSAIALLRLAYAGIRTLSAHRERALVHLIMHFCHPQRATATAATVHNALQPITAESAYISLWYIALGRLVLTLDRICSPKAYVSVAQSAI